MNYRIHADAIKENLILLELTKEQIAYTYANEADMLNAVLIEQGKKQSERLILLCDLVMKQMKTMDYLTMTGLNMLTKKENE